MIDVRAEGPSRRILQGDLGKGLVEVQLYTASIAWETSVEDNNMPRRRGEHATVPQRSSAG
jgi:hypothetical protein